MRHERVLGVIPARLGSERLPRKPLVRLDGRPLIEWVWQRARRVPVLDACVIATDSVEVATVCRAFGATVELTSESHPSGTDRVAEVAARAAYTDYGIVVNVQGDEPFLATDHVGAAVAEVRAGRDIGTVACPLGTLAAWRDPSVVKVVRRADGRALYFSRAPIPHARAGDPSAELLGTSTYLRHIGVYAFRRDALLAMAGLPESGLEVIERLEQLRALEAGLRIGVAVVAGDAEGGVDTPEDVARAEAKLRAGVQA